MYTTNETDHGANAKCFSQTRHIAVDGHRQNQHDFFFAIVARILLEDGRASSCRIAGAGVDQGVGATYMYGNGFATIMQKNTNAYVYIQHSTAASVL